jgi:trehalose/maltose hydrolase-like predicted phosphorylase
MSDASGLALRLRALRLVSASERATGLQLLQIDVEAGSVDLTLEASCEGLTFGMQAERLDQAFGVWRTNTTGKGLGIATGLTLRVEGEVIAPATLGPFRWIWTWRARPGQSVCLERLVAFARGDTPEQNPGRRAKDKLAAAQKLGWEGILAGHEAAWARSWHDSDVVVGGDPATQQALRFALYHLNSAANPEDDRVSIAARGLTGGDYHGHVFWDTEVFLLPFYTLTWPAAARAMLHYRFRTLDGARAKARVMGWRGALYAWESADTGAEATPDHVIGPDRRIVAILCGKQEQHISADVAYAVWHYWHVTGDNAFLREAGAEILLETARFWASRARLEADGLRHIRGVIGPDEYHETIDDNAFTNMMARWNIHRAIDVAAILRDRWPSSWAALSHKIGLEQGELGSWPGIADTIATGLNPKAGLFEQCAGFFGYEEIDLADYAGRSVPMDVVLGRERLKTAQVVKQADVVALLVLLPEAFPGEAAERNFDYYEKRCSHGSSLSRAMHGVAAARLGRAEQALGFFRQNAAIDLAESHAAIDGGIHVAALGGTWMIAVLGFAGLSCSDDGIRLQPQLPAAWQSMTFRIQWRSRHVLVAIEGHAVRVTLEAGDPMLVAIAAEQYRLCCEAPVEARVVPALSPGRDVGLA